MMKIQLVIYMLLAGCCAFGQTFSDNISKELMLEKVPEASTLIIANINGAVKVAAYEGSSIKLEAVRTIKAKTEERLALGKQEVELGVIDRYDTLIIYIKSGCLTFARNENSGGWGYQSEPGSACHNNSRYDFRMDFTLKVPAALSVQVSTINQGGVEVSGVRGSVKASNINGGINLMDVQNQTSANTINGDLDVVFAGPPSKNSRFYTLNGNINVMLPRGMSADLAFESFNGGLYTNIDRIEGLPAKIERTKRTDGLTYRISGNNYRLRNGGPLLDFETFNGNVYLREK